MPDQPIPHRYVRCEKCKAPWMLPTTIEPDRLRACPKCCTPADLAQGPILRGFSKRGGAADGQTYSQVPAGVQPPKSTAQPLGAFRRLSSDAEESHGYAQVNGFTQRPSAEKEHPQTYISQPTDCAGPPTQTCLAAPLPSVGQDDQPLYPRIFPHGHILQENYAEDRRNGLYALQDSIRSQLTKQRRIRVPFIAELSSIAQQILSARGQGLSSAPDLDIIHGIDSDDMLNLSIDDTRRSAGNEVSDFQLEGKHSPIDQRNQTSIVSELPSHTVATKQVLATEGPLAKDRDTASQTTCDPPMPGQKPIYRKVAILPSTPFSHYELDLILQLYGKSLGCGHQLRLGWITQGTSLTGFDRDPASLVVVFYDPDSRCHWKGVRHRDPAVDGLLQELDGAGASVDQDDEDDNPYRTRRWLPKHRDDFKCHPCFIEGKKCDGKSPCSTCVQRRSVCREQDPESTAQILDAAHKPRIFDPKSRRPRTDPCAACFRSRIMTCDGVVPCNNCRSAGRASQCNWDHKVAKKKEQRGSQSEGDRPLPLAVSVEERYCSGCGHLDHTFHGFRYSQIENHRHQHVCDRCFVEEGETGRHSSHSRERKCWYCFKENVEGRSFTVALVDGEEGPFKSLMPMEPPKSGRRDSLNAFAAVPVGLGKVTDFVRPVSLVNRAPAGAKNVTDSGRRIKLIHMTLLLRS
ncbi:hypothetical protein ABEF95_004215 [Exophiala dermatitidis]